MSTTPMRANGASPRRRWLAGLALTLALPLMAALWTAVALWLGAPAAWMAIVVAADAGLLLGLMGLPPGRTRATFALGFLVLGTALSLWLVAAGVVGAEFGLMPWESALRLGPALFSSIAEGWLAPSNLAWLAAAAALAIWWNR